MTPTIQRLAEFRQGGLRPGVDGGELKGITQQRIDREVVRQGVGLHRLDRLVADAARRRVDDPQQADLVSGVDDAAEVGHGVLDLGPLVEGGAPRDLVRHPGVTQRILHHNGSGC